MWFNGKIRIKLRKPGENNQTNVMPWYSRKAMEKKERKGNIVLGNGGKRWVTITTKPTFKKGKNWDLK